MKAFRSCSFAALALGTIFWPVQAVDAEGGGDIVVEGRRDERVLDGGEWLVSISRSYHFGKSLDGREFVPAAGKERDWRFCIPATQVEALVTLLTGEGHSESAGTTHCPKLKVRLGDGRLRATQTCQGGNVSRFDETRKRVITDRTRVILTVTGTYDAGQFRLDFDDRREFDEFDPTQVHKPDMTRWSITGRHLGACVPQSEKPDAP
jgi:hypothetical protein